MESGASGGPIGEAATAETLEGMARSAESCGDLRTAAVLLEQAALRSSDPWRAHRLLCEAGVDAVRSGEAHGIDLLPDVRAHAAAPDLAAQAGLLMVLSAAQAGDLAQAGRIAEEADHREEAATAARMHALAATTAFVAQDSARYRDHTLRAIHHARDLPGPDRVYIDAFIRPYYDAYRGRAWEDFDAQLAQSWAQMDPELCPPIAFVLLHHDLLEPARLLLETQLLRARAEERRPTIAWVQINSANLLVRRGRYAQARAAASEALAVARSIALTFAEQQAHSALALIEALRGRIDACHEHAAVVETIADRTGLRASLLDARLAEGRAALTGADPARAAALLRRAAGTLAEWGDQGRCVWTSDLELVEAHVRNRDLDAARAVLASAEAVPGTRTTATGRAWLAYAQLAVAAEERLDEAFAWSCTAADATEDPHLQARVRLLYGEKARRAGRRVPALTALRTSRARFDALGAPGWTRRADRELSALGDEAGVEAERIPPASASWAALTPQQRQIAYLAARGTPTRQIAGSLFLSPKTVEYHLTQIYRALGVASKAELAATYRAP